MTVIGWFLYLPGLFIEIGGLYRLITDWS